MRRLVRRAGRAGPVLAMLMLLAWPAVLARGGATEADIARQKAIAVSMSDVPQILGRWAGADVAVPTEATQILRPNAILSRRYSEIGGARVVTLAFIHCGDVRDMLGHFPPVCYPANGWTLDLWREVQVVANDGREWPMRFYRFTRAERGGGIRFMTVSSGFLLPDGRGATDMEALTERSVKKAVSAEGVAQIQFVFDSDMFDNDAPSKSAVEVVQELLSALPSELLRQLGAGTSGRVGAEPIAEPFRVRGQEGER